MTVKLNVRVTSKSKCREGFYLLVNGIRLHFRTRALALRSVTDWLALQRLQICTVREYAGRNRKKIAARMPPAWLAETQEHFHGRPKPEGQQ